VIVTLNDDTTAIFTTLIASDLNPDVDVIVRANEPESKGKLYRAGAAYVQSLATVSGRMLASTIYEDESVLAVGRQIDVVELPVGRLAGRTLADADVRSRPARPSSSSSATGRRSQSSIPTRLLSSRTTRSSRGD